MSNIPELGAGKTRRSLRNAIVGLIFFFAMMALQFVSRKVFIDYLGADILGMNSMTVSMLEFLNIAELGIGAAVGISIYRPLAVGNQTAILEILAIHRNLYRKVALIITFSAIILSLFFPLIYAKSGLPLWYAYSTFGVMLFSALAGYVWNYRQVLLSASQQEYKVQIAYRLPKCVQVLLQIICIVKFPQYGYQLWLILEVAGTMVATLLLNRMVSHTFPGWAVSAEDTRTLRRRYPEVVGQVKRLMFHKIGGFLVRQMSPLVVYAYLSLEVVAVYGNYILIVTGVNRLIEALFRGQEAFIGHISHTADLSSQHGLFREYFAVRFYLATVCSYIFIECAAPFIKVWVGEAYLLSETATTLIGLILFFNILRGAVETFLLAKGQTGDIWAPIAEGGIALAASLLLGYWYGLDGVLGGVVISQVLFVGIWKPIYLLHKGLDGSIFRFYMTFIKQMIVLIFALSVEAAWKIFENRPLDEIDNFSNICQGCVIFIVVFTCALLLADSGFRRFPSRILNTFRLKKENK